MIDNINLKTVMKFTLPSISAMVFLSLYTMVDGIFVSNFIGTNALSATNIVFPAITLFYAIGTMFGAGGNAICATLLGEGNLKQARQKLTLFITTAFSLGLLITLFVVMNLTDILYLLGANSETFDYAYDFMFFIALFAPFCIIQIIMENALIAAGRPGLSLITILAGGATNVVLDYIFIKLGFGMAGIGIATGLGYIVPCLISGIYFSTNRKAKDLCFSKFSFDYQAILKACSNGLSEMVTMLAGAIINYLFNIITLKLAGNAGVSAITVILYSQMLFNSLFVGYTTGIAPVISFNFGAKNSEKLKKLFELNLKIVGCVSFSITLMALLFSDVVASLFLKNDAKGLELAIGGLSLFAYSFLFSGFNIFCSGMFTAYSNGRVSALVSFLRTFLFITVSLLVLPKFLGMTGVWLAIPIAEFLSFFIAVYFINKSKVYIEMTKESESVLKIVPQRV